MITPLTPQKINILESPEEITSCLQHLPDLIFFDTAGNLPSHSQAPVSIIAARPKQIIKGHIKDTQALKHSISNYHTHSPSLGFPSGGACGWIDYEGDFCFGIYPEMLIYQHDKGQWWQCGALANEIKRTSANKAKRIHIGKFTSSMTQREYEEKVRQIHKYISAGDIYQANLTQKFSAHFSGDSLFNLYLKLRKATPAPLATWMNLGNKEILSSSPETFLRMSGRNIETCPIKGTRPRSHCPETDLKFAEDLIHSEKENAELTMITDLERNDLGKVCDFGTVRVTEMLRLEKLEQVYHLVSTVTGHLQEATDHLDALLACFPGGSITGAPKKRAMEIIKELEPVPRGLYTGAIGYIGFNGESQFNIPIRTLVKEKETLHYHVGAGIVADSNPAAEYKETLDKAKGIRLALSQFSE